MSKNLIEIKTKLDNLENDMAKIIGCMETLENSLYFSSERTDKDITKPCAMCVLAIIKMLENCQETVEEINEGLDV